LIPTSARFFLSPFRFLVLPLLLEQPTPAGDGIRIVELNSDSMDPRLKVEREMVK
jgi:hypothetical protein